MLIVPCSYQVLVPIQHLQAQQYFREFGSYLGINPPKLKSFVTLPITRLEHREKLNVIILIYFRCTFPSFVAFSQQVIMLQ